MPKRITNKVVLDLIDNGQAKYKEGQPKKVFSQEDAHKELQEKYCELQTAIDDSYAKLHAEINATFEATQQSLIPSNNESKITEVHQALFNHIEDIHQSITDKISMLFNNNYTPILKQIEKKQNTLLNAITTMPIINTSEEWDFDVERNASGRMTSVKARKIQ
jgi:hypothetical protein